MGGENEEVDGKELSDGCSSSGGGNLLVDFVDLCLYCIHVSVKYSTCSKEEIS